MFMLFLSVFLFLNFAVEPNKIQTIFSEVELDVFEKDALEEEAWNCYYGQHVEKDLVKAAR